MKRVGIITLMGNFNFGNRLQNYAVTRIYEKKGLAATTLRAVRPNVVREIKKVVKVLLGRQDVNPESLMSPNRIAAFRRFNSNMTFQTFTKVDSGICGDFDYFSTGSDQVWNPAMIAYNTDWFFLDFARPEQRIALAPSIGLDTLSHRQARILKRGVSNFPHPSVREKRGAELIREFTGIDAEVVCDPTLVLGASEWREVANGGLTPVGPYVLTYLLGNIGADTGAILQETTENGEIPIIPLSDRQKSDEPDAGPAEFIDLIDHASHVVTDSFHAAVFASILQTPLTIVRREGGRSMFSRLEQLSQTLGIEHKVFGSPDFDLSRVGDYEGVPEAIERERKKFMGYLEMCLDG